MTYNIYVGADLMPILTETVPDSIVLRVLEAFLAMQSTQYPERARQIADDIIREQPHLVGLQEVSIINLQSPGDWPSPNPADTEFIDFKKVLVRDGVQSGNIVEGHYAVNLEAPMPIGPPIVLVGDFNSDADGSTSDTYSMVLNAGYTDAWLAGNGSGSEYTCCQTADLMQSDYLSRRIDYSPRT